MENIDKMKENIGNIDLSVLLEKIETFDNSFGAVGTTIDFLSQKKRDALSLFDNNTYEKYQEESRLVSGVEKILENTGLDLKLEKETSTNPDGSDELEYEELVPYLKNGKQFVQYLKSIDSNTITESQLMGIGIISHDLVNRLHYSDISDPKNENFYEIITNGEEMLNELKRLGVIEFERHGWAGTFDPILMLENLMHNLKEGCLKEFMIAYRLQKSDMYSFVFSTDPEILKQDWEKILSKILKIHENPKAINIYSETVSEAKIALEKAVTNFQDRNKNAYIDDKTMEKFIRAINTVRSRLEDF